jgi:putative isomerase
VDTGLLELLKNRITLDEIPFTERGSRIMMFRKDTRSLWIGLAEYEVDIKENRLIESLQFTDKNGTALDFSLTTYPHEVICETAVGSFHLGFVDGETLLIAPPTGCYGIRLDLKAEAIRPDRRGGVLDIAGKTPARIAYTTNAMLLRNEIGHNAGGQGIHLMMESSADNALLINITQSPGLNRLVPDPAATFEASARRWHDWFSAVPRVAEEYRSLYYYAWWIMGVNLIRTRFYPKHEGMVPSKIGYVGVWHWDAYFHALAFRHVDTKLAQDQFRILLEHQFDNGMIPDVVHDGGVLADSRQMVEADRTESVKFLEHAAKEALPPADAALTKPPLTAWAVWKVYEVDSDRDFLDEIYDSIASFQGWWFAECDSDHNGLCEYHHPYSSGLDNSPLWDHGLPVESPDLNAYLCLQYDHLSKIAHVIGKPEQAARWSDQAHRLAQRLIDRRWDDKAGLFWAYKHQEQIACRTPFNLYPLITGRMPAHIADRLVGTLTDERQFWCRYPVPTVALDDPKYDPLVMWRGPVWISPNYLLIDGLQRSGYVDVARELRQRTLALVASNNDIYEYYHPITGERPPGATNMFGWSAALFIDLAIADSKDR